MNNSSPTIVTNFGFHSPPTHNAKLTGKFYPFLRTWPYVWLCDTNYAAKEFLPWSNPIEVAAFQRAASKKVIVIQNRVPFWKQITLSLLLPFQPWCFFCGSRFCQENRSNKNQKWWKFLLPERKKRKQTNSNEKIRHYNLIIKHGII